MSDEHEDDELRETLQDVWMEHQWRQISHAVKGAVDVLVSDGWSRIEATMIATLCITRKAAP